MSLGAKGLIDPLIQSSPNRYSTNSEKPQKYTHPKEELKNIWQMKAIYKVPLVLSVTGIIPAKILDSLKLLSLCTCLYIFSSR